MPTRDLSLRLAILACIALLSLLAAGCSHSNGSEDQGPGFIGIVAPQPPAFLSGPASVLLTNAGGYSARLEAQTDAILERDRSVSGQLLCRGAQLYFAPDPKGKKSERGGFSFLWNAASNSGYVLSEALQGYAPITGGPRATNVVLTPLQTASDDISGHPCSALQATVQLENGSSRAFQVMRAPDLGNIALRVTAATNEIPLTLTLSKVLPFSPEAGVFSIPDGFTRYADPQTMADELVAREHNIMRKGTEISPLSPEQPNPGAAAGGMGPRF